VLLIAATPIGNLKDASVRLREALETADVIVAEDTRVIKSLITSLGLSVHASFLSAHEHSEGHKADRIVTQSLTSLVVLVSDAGMPLVNDPGYLLVAKARERGAVVSIVPGPSAGLAALAVSGLPTDRFVHEGFVPKKGRVAYLESLSLEARTMIFFESPHRLHQTLADMATVWGEARAACVVRELTKMFEEVAWGSLAELRDRFRMGTKGEIVIVVGGQSAVVVSSEDALHTVNTLIAGGMKRSEACAVVAKETGIPKSELYIASVGGGPSESH
jgi:16S rRNA (cytidine1402-2'-O)-methyltransferase